MSCEKPSVRLPLIDLSELEDEWESVRFQVVKAAEEYGCFQISYEKIPLHLQAAFFDGLQHLFDLPLTNKMKYPPDRPFRGYMGESPFMPYESISVDEPFQVEENAESMCNTLWPQGNPTLSKNIISISKQMSEIDSIIRRMILESLGMEKHLEEHMESAMHVLRITKYPAPKRDETQVSLSAHTDNDIITILCQNKVDGLEIQTKSGEWIKVKLSPNSYIAFVGESFQAWTNGRVYAAPHRVSMRGNEERISAGLFSIFKAGHIVKAPQELVDEEHPLLYKPFDHSVFLKAFSQNLHWALFPIKTYCGV